MIDKTNGQDSMPNETDLPREKIIQMVNSVSLTAQDGIRGMREVSEKLTRSLKERGDTVVKFNEEYAALCQASVDAMKIVGDGLAVLLKRFDESPLPATISGTSQKVLPMPEVLSMPAASKFEVDTVKLEEALVPPEVSKYAPKKHIFGRIEAGEKK